MELKYMRFIPVIKYLILANFTTMLSPQKLPILRILARRLIRPPILRASLPAIRSPFMPQYHFCQSKPVEKMEFKA
jgi:hypothetical protein